MSFLAIPDFEVITLADKKKEPSLVPFSLNGGERGSQTYGFLEYHKIRKWMYVSRL